MEWGEGESCEANDDSEHRTLESNRRLMAHVPIPPHVQCNITEAPKSP